MRLVVVESPYAGDVERNMAYAKAAMADSLARGEAPFASHLLYTHEGILDDTVPEQRRQGIAAGLAWGQHAILVAVYTDLGITPGMRQGIDQARKRGQLIETRSLDEWRTW